MENPGRDCGAPEEDPSVQEHARRSIWHKLAKDKERHVSKKMFSAQGSRQFFSRKKVLHTSTASHEHFFLNPNKVYENT